MTKSKCLITNITHIGYELSNNQISPSKQKIVAVKRFAVPKTEHQLHQESWVISETEVMSDYQQISLIILHISAVHH